MKIVGRGKQLISDALGEKRCLAGVCREKCGFFWLCTWGCEIFQKLMSGKFISLVSFKKEME